MSTEPMRFTNYYRHCGAEIEPYDSGGLPRGYQVIFYTKDDPEMNTTCEFLCNAVSEEDAEEQCLAANPGCTTTHIEECE